MEILQLVLFVATVIITGHRVAIAADAAIDNKNIAFDLPDLITTENTASGSYQLSAYRSVSNDVILADKDSTRTSQLFWVSVGHPTFLSTNSYLNRSISRLFHFTRQGFNTYIEMLTKEQRSLLAEAARTKYSKNIADSQIVNLVLSSFQCSLIMYDDVGSKYLLKGVVTDFLHFPLRMDFLAPAQSIERKLFTELISGEEVMIDLMFDCRMASSGKVLKTNTLTISAEQQQQIGLEEKLFGNAGSSGTSDVYVTRNQMSQLASEMYTTLNIIEDYQMPEVQFSETFVNDLITQLASKDFAQVPIDSVLSSLSKYGFDVSADLKPDIIKHDLGSILKVETRNEKSHIILDEEAYRKFETAHKESGGVDVDVGALFVSLSTSVNWAKDAKDTNENKESSLSDQLRELNTASRDEVQWQIEGERVVPKSLNVARLTQSKLGKKLTFSRIRIQSIVAAFQPDFTMYSRRSVVDHKRLVVLEDEIRTLNETIDSLQSQLSVAAIESATLKRDISSAQVQLTNNANRINTVNSQLTSNTNSLAQTINVVNSQLTNSINAVSASAVRRCRICFLENSGTTNNQCRGAKNTCSGWSDHGEAWTGAFIDDTDDDVGGCQYQWRIECTP